MTEQNTHDDLVGKLVRGEIESNLDKRLKMRGFRPCSEATKRNGKIEFSSYLGIDEFYLGQTDLRLVDITSLGIFDEKIGERFIVYIRAPKKAEKIYSYPTRRESILISL